MKKLTATLTLFIFSTLSVFSQRYTTMGIAQYQKDLNGKYVLTHKILDYETTWVINSDNTITWYKEDVNSDMDINKKTKVGNVTTYYCSVFNAFKVKVIIQENGYITYIEGTDGETKNVYRIVKKEKS